MNKKNIDYLILNGYQDIIAEKYNSDIDILLRKIDFNRIESILNEFCELNKLKIVQTFHHEVWAKNIFLFDFESQQILNLDIYGVISRNNVPLFTEQEVFGKAYKFKNLMVLDKDHEFLYYLIKKVDKNEMTEEKYHYLRDLYLSKKSECNSLTKKYFPRTHSIIENSFMNSDFKALKRNDLMKDFLKSKDKRRHNKNAFRLVKRLFNPTGITIAFLGVDGSGKSTVIELIRESNLPFRKFQYFHLKPIIKGKSKIMISNPHQYPSYGSFKSYLKLLFLIFQYNFNWVRNVIPLKIKSTLIVFDRYFDDLLIDPKRFRYGGNISAIKWARKFIPRPDILFVFTADPEIIYSRKKEVEFFEVKRQLNEYDSLAFEKKYYLIDVNRVPEQITQEIIHFIMIEMSKRFN